MNREQIVRQYFPNDLPKYVAFQLRRASILGTDIEKRYWHFRGYAYKPTPQPDHVWLLGKSVIDRPATYREHGTRRLEILMHRWDDEPIPVRECWPNKPEGDPNPVLVRPVHLENQARAALEDREARIKHAASLISCESLHWPKKEES